MPAGRSARVGAGDGERPIVIADCDYPASRRSAMSRSWGHRFAIAAFIGLVGAGACSRSKDQKGATPPPAQSVLQPALDQGWTSADRDSFYTTPQGSQLVRFDWYSSLEQPGTSE